MYPNGSADVNYFHACGGMPLLIKTLLNGGLLHRDVNTILGHGLENSLKNHTLKMVFGSANVRVNQQTNPY